MGVAIVSCDTFFTAVYPQRCRHLTKKVIFGIFFNEERRNTDIKKKRKKGRQTDKKKERRIKRKTGSKNVNN